MALDPSSKNYAHTLANDFVVQGLIALLIKTRPEDDVAGALNEYVVKQIAEAVVSGGVNAQEQEEFKAEVRRVSDQLIIRGRNAAF